MALPPSTSAKALVTTGSPVRVILKLALPTVLAMLTQSAVNEVDIIFFSRLPCPESSTAQAALLPSLILLWMFGGSLSAISVGTQAISARRFAEGKATDAGAVLVNSWVCSLLAGVLFTAVGYLVMPLALSALIRVPEVRLAALGYLKWRLLGITSMAATFSFKAFFDGIGKTHVHMVASVVMNIINVVLCITLIFGHFGAPRLGMTGAGLAGAGLAGAGAGAAGAGFGGVAGVIGAFCANTGVASANTAAIATPFKRCFMIVVLCGSSGFVITRQQRAQPEGGPCEPSAQKQQAGCFVPTNTRHFTSRIRPCRCRIIC